MTTISSDISDTMRTEADFLEQAALAQSALQQFITVKDFDNADETKCSALNKLMKHTVLYSPKFYHIISDFSFY